MAKALTQAKQSTTQGHLRAVLSSELLHHEVTHVSDALAGISAVNNEHLHVQIVHHKPDPWDEVHLVVWKFDALFAIPIIVFGFNCHANVVSIFKWALVICSSIVFQAASCSAHP